MTLIAPAPVEQLQGDPDILHTTCCRDDDLTLCSADATDMAHADAGDPCIVCTDLDLLDVCPHGWECPE